MFLTTQSEAKSLFTLPPRNVISKLAERTFDHKVIKGIYDLIYSVKACFDPTVMAVRNNKITIVCRVDAGIDRHLSYIQICFLMSVI